MSAPFITPSMRVALRTLASNQFNDSADIYTHTAADSVVGMSETWTYVGTVACWVKQMNNPDLKPDVGGLYTLGQFRILMPWGTTVGVGDQLVISGSTYLVQNTNVEDTNAISLVLYGQKLENS